MKNIIINNTRVLTIIRILLSIILFITPIIYLAIFVFQGVSCAFGNKINLFTAIDLTIGMLDIFTGAIYRPLFGAILGIIYFAFFGLIIKSIFTSVKTFKFALKQNNKDPDKYHDRPVFVTLLMNEFGHTLFLLVLYMVISRMIGAYSLSALSVGIIVSGLIICILSKVGICIMDKKNLAPALYYNVLQDGIILSALAIFFSCVCHVDIYEFFNGFPILSAMINKVSTTTIVSVIGEFFIKNGAFIVLQAIALEATKEILMCYNYDKTVDKLTAKSLLTATISVSLILVAFSMYCSDTYNIYSVFNVLKNYVAIIACSLTLFLSLNLPPIESKNNAEADDNNTSKQPDSIDEYTNNTWICSCGARNTGKSCSVCFKSRPNNE